MSAEQPHGEPASGRLLADVGGTHARFAWQATAGAPLHEPRVYPVADHASLGDAVAAYLGEVGRSVTAAAIAIATPVTGDEVRMTNHRWAFSQQALRQRFGWRHLRVLNDFTALARALPDLAPADLQQVGGDVAEAHAPLALLGAGTGLGVSGLVPDGFGGWLPLAGEGGHVTWAAVSPRERLVFDALARQYGHVSAERVASGQGLVDVFMALCAVDRVVVQPDLTARAVSDAALQQGHPQALETLDLFAATLGRVAGDLALTLGARGGVYLGGGIVPRLGSWFAGSPFRAQFESKGRFASYLSRIPVWVITADPSPALQGAARALDGLSC
ncbi:MAG: glucokinase [Burkholderiaceae bacterium]